jgi:hypothetical protein
MTYTVRYHDRNPINPLARWEIHRANVTAQSEQTAKALIEDCDCEVIDVTEYIQPAILAHSVWDWTLPPSDMPEIDFDNIDPIPF